MSNADRAPIDPNAPPTAEAGRLMRHATVVAVGVAGGLALMKLVAWLTTGSVAVAASFVDSLLDIGASSVNLVAVAIALRPADADHRFGHTKAEPLAGLAQSAFVIGSAAFLSLEAIGRLLSPVPVVRGEVAIGVMIVATVATLGLVAYQRSVSRRTGSVAVAADSLHYTADLLTHVAVIAGVVLSGELGWSWADPVFAIAIAAFLVVGGVRIARRSIDLLMDRELADDVRARILAIAAAEPGVLACQALRTRSAGLRHFVELRLVMARELPLWEAHAIGERVAAGVRAELPRAEIIIHHDPEGSHPHDPAEVLVADAERGATDGP